MNKIKFITQVATLVTIVACIVFLFVPMLGWMFSLGVLVGGAFGIFDFWVIVQMVSMLKKSMEDTKLMMKFTLLFLGKTFLLLGLLAVIVFILARLGKIITFGFIAGLIVIPLAIVVSAFKKIKD